MNVMRNVITAALMTVVTTVLLGIVYPLAITGIAQVMFPDKANGQLIERTARSSARESSARASRRQGTFARGPRPPGLGTTRPTRRARSSGRPTRSSSTTSRANVEAARKENASAPVPIDLVTTSASGLDPHLSPAAADFQVPRVARNEGWRSRTFARSSPRTPRAASSAFSASRA